MSNSKIIGFTIASFEIDHSDIDVFKSGLNRLHIKNRNQHIYLWGIGNIQKCIIDDCYTLSFPLSANLLDRNVLLKVSEDKIELENDWLGSIPVFYNEQNGSVSTLINKVLPNNQISIDNEGLKYYFQFGYCVFTKTPVKNVRFLRYYSKIELMKGQLSIIEKDDPVHDLMEGYSKEEDTFNLIRKYINDVEKQAQGDIILPTSGGYDSRLLNVLVQDKQKIQSFTYGLSENQTDSFEVVIARKLSELSGTRWRQIELGKYNKYIPEWFSLYGISTHTHGMYHIEFYHKIRALLAGSTRGQITFLSGIFGDVWAGNVAYQEVNSHKDLRKLGYTHGMDFNEISDKIESEDLEAKSFYDKYKENLKDYRWQPIITIRAKIILISYLMNLPDYFGFPSWTPYLNFDIVGSMLNIPKDRWKGRRWQKDFFIKNNLDLDRYISQSDLSNVLNLISVWHHMPEILDRKLLSDYVNQDIINLVNSNLLNYSRQASLENTSANQIAWTHYIKYLVLKALELLLRKKTSMETLTQLKLLNQQGEALFIKGDIAGALTAFKKAIELDPFFATAYNNLGTLYWQTGEAQKAINNFKKAMEIAPNDRDAIFNYGTVLTSLEKFKDAKNLYSSYLQKNPNDKEISRFLSSLEERVKTKETESRLSWPSWLPPEDQIDKLIIEFLKLYALRPIQNNDGGVKSVGAFSLWFFLRRINPNLVIESGVWKGLTTWLIESSLPDANIICLDPHPEVRQYTSKKAIYPPVDFADMDFGDENFLNALVFFDDHQNAYKRVLQAWEKGFTHLIFDDNYPGENDSHLTLQNCLSLGKNEATHLQEIIEKYEIFPPLYQYDKPITAQKVLIDIPALNIAYTPAFEILKQEMCTYRWMTYIKLATNPQEERVKTKETEKCTHYKKDYFDYQKNIGAFGGVANIFKFKEVIRDADNVIDFGCGGGYLLNNIQCKNKIGVDINEIACREARKIGIDVVKNVDDLTDAFADVIISNHALEHVYSPIDILKALYSKLKPSGKIVFVVPHQGPHEKYTLDDINKHLFTWNPLTLGNLFAEAGYKVINVETIQHQWPPNYVELYNKVGEDEFHKICRECAIKNNNYQVRIIATTKESTEFQSNSKDLYQNTQNYFPKGSKNREALNDIPVILVTYKRPSHTDEVLKALRQHNIQKLYIFSDGPKSDSDLPKIMETRTLFQKIDWCKPEIIEREKNIGLAKSIVGAVNYVFTKHDRLILLEDDCIPQKHFFDFIGACLNKYENNEKIFGISGYTVPVPDSILSKYPYDLYFFPRIGSWGWATWKRAWQHLEPDLAKAYKKARDANIDISQGGTDIPVMIQNMMNGQLRDVWTLNWVLSVYLKNGYYIYPTTSHIDNIGWDGSGAHCGKANGSVTPIADRKPTLYPSDVLINQHIYHNFRSYYDIPGQQNEQISSTQQNKGKQNKALPCLSNDPAIDSHNTELIIHQAIEQLNANNNAEALRLFEQATSKSHNMPGIAYGKAIAVARLGRRDEAIETLRHLLAVMPEHKKARLLLNELVDVQVL